MSHEYNESLIERERILIDVFFSDFASNVIDISLYCFILTLYLKFFYTRIGRP
jgi:hypothetical protein